VVICGNNAILQKSLQKVACEPYLLSSWLLSSLELSDSQVYVPEIRALLGAASHFFEEAFLTLRTVPVGTALS